jgi:hypothetical protein
MPGGIPHAFANREFGTQDSIAAVKFPAKLLDTGCQANFSATR